MTRTPTKRELEILRYLNAGMHVGPETPPRRNRAIVARGVAVISVQHGTIEQLLAAGWLDTELKLTKAGRDVADCKAFVRAFAEGV